MGAAPKTHVYLDTEFTSLNRSSCKLISVALVVFEGPELYFELSDNWIESDCFEFVQNTVLPLLNLDTHGLTILKARLAVRRWLEQFEYVEIYTDAPEWDWCLFKNLFGDIFPKLALGKIEANGLEYRELPEPPHHALMDARLLAEALEQSKNLTHRANE